LVLVLVLEFFSFFNSIYSCTGEAVFLLSFLSLIKSSGFKKGFSSSDSEVISNFDFLSFFKALGYLEFKSQLIKRFLFGLFLISSSLSLEL